MSGQILIVEPIPTQRIVLRALLEKARYRVEHCHDVAAARAMIAAGLAPDMILVRSFGETTETDRFAHDIAALRYGSAGLGLALMAERRSLGRGSGPVIVAIEDAQPQAQTLAESRDVPLDRVARTDHATPRLRALLAGADDVISRPFADSVFLARIRSLLRARAESEDLRPRSAIDLVAGFAEQAEAFQLPERIVVLTPGLVRSGPGAADLAPGLPPALAGLIARAPSRFEVHPVSVDFDASDDRNVGPAAGDFDEGGAAPDLIIIAPGVGLPGGMIPGDIFRLLAELRSRTPLRLAAQLLILPPDMPDLSVMALDMSVDDLVTEDISRGELSHRVETLLRGKRVTDGLRATLRQDLEAAVIDPLTGLHNRRFALPHLAMLSREADRTQRPFAVMMLDIDHFKAINDTHGHSTGDTVLCDVARRLKAELRPRDLLARIGGEEFLVVLPDTGEADASDVAERLRVAIARRPFDGNAPECPRPRAGRARIEVTLSVGVAMGGGPLAGKDAPTDLVERADGALYAAKEAGRNKVTLCATAA